MLTPLAEFLVMWGSFFFDVKGSLNTHPFPNFQAIRNSLRIRFVKAWAANVFAAFAPLVVYSHVVLVPSIHSDCSGNCFARPAVGVARGVVAYESAGDPYVLCLDAAVVVVRSVEGEGKIVVFQLLHDGFMQGWKHGPRAFLVRHVEIAKDCGYFGQLNKIRG